MLENELKSYKAAYLQVMSQDQRRKYDRYLGLVKDFTKYESQLANYWKDNDVLASLRKEIKNFFRLIENGYKFQNTDYEAFLWKVNRQKNMKQELKQLDNFKFLKIQTPKSKLSLSDLDSLDFPVLSLKISQLCQFATKILLTNSFCRQNYSEDILSQLVRSISCQYNIVSYHNFSHAFSLQLQLYQCYTRISKLQKYYQPFEIGIAYISGLAHDLNHNGTNSIYQIQSKTSLAIKYNHESVLENMHVSHFYKLMRQNSKIDIFNSIKNVIEKQKAKRLIIKLILATDIARHFPSLGTLKARIQNKQSNNPILPLNLQVFEDRQFVMQHIFHSCDIGNSCLSFQNYMNWAVLLSYEFNSQTNLQKANKLEVTQMLRYKGIKPFYEGQIGFVNNLVLPQWKTLGILFPQLKEFIENVQKNIRQLNKLKDNIQTSKSQK